jgi:hypothetical protein
MNNAIKTLILIIAVYASACTKPNEQKTNAQQSAKSIDITVIEKIIGMKGVSKDGEYKVTVAQNDLNVMVDSFKIIPPMGLGSWAAFTSSPDGPMVMGDIIITENELKPVQEEVIKQGLTVTAIHNHFVRDKPHVMYMHIGGMDTEENLALKVKAVFEKVKEVRGINPADGKKDSVQNTLDTQMLDNILGVKKGEMSRGVYKHTIGRPDIKLKDHSASVSTFLGFNTWVAWQGTHDRAAVAGDFAMLENEVAPVIKALIENGIEVVAVHNHMVHEEPRIFFLHYWGIGPAETLAKGLKAALDQTGKNENQTAASLGTRLLSDLNITNCKTDN